MSRIDTTTIVIVVILILALGVLGYQLYKLYQDDDTLPSESLEQYEPQNTLPETDYYDAPEDGGDLYGYDTSSGSAYVPPVEPEPLPDTEPSGGFTVDEETLPPNTYGDYLVLAGSFEYKHNAESQARKLRGKGYNNAQVVLFNRGAYAVVLVDRFTDYADARALASRLETEAYVDAFVLEKRSASAQR